MISVRFDPVFDRWLLQAQELLADGHAPGDILWLDTSREQPVLPGMGEDLPQEDTGGSTRPHRRVPHVPRQFITLARQVSAHRTADKWPLLYSVLHRLTYDNPRLLQIEVDDEVARLLTLKRQVDRDAHKMKAFVRFRRLRRDDLDCYVAWHQPDHDVLPMVAPFFAERFASMNWTILTPGRSAHWDGGTLRFGPGVEKNQAPAGDDLENLWRTYYAAIFNPARVKVAAMRAEMPVRYWDTLPETRLIPELLAVASRRTFTMLDNQQHEPSAQPFVPAGASLSDLRAAAARCTGCPLHLDATQTVFGEGPANAKIVLVGEQPGDDEDIQGRPFVGPAGRVLQQALRDAGLDRDTVYVTNAVKHFKFVATGTRRKHSAPRYSEIVACRPWFEAELTALQPKTLVCLGATSAKSLFGAGFRLMQQRGRWLTTPWASRAIATLHPSAILRAPDDHTRHRLYALLVSDLLKATEVDDR